MTARHPYADFVHLVDKPARYLGGEYQSVKKDWDAVEARICLAFPDLYDIGMSHLGTKILYGLLNKHPAIACERAFTPWVDMERELRERGLPVLSLESARPLADFDVVGFSLQYEMTYTNVLTLLDLSGLPLRSADRTDAHPLVIAGGPTTTHPEPMAPFVDAFLVGDAEELLPRSLLAITAWRREGLPRMEILRRLADMTGWYCPALYALRVDERSGLLVVDPDVSEGPYPVMRATVDDLNRYPFPDDAPVAAAEAIFDRMSIEIARGCTEGCRFCQAGMIYRPVRERDPEQIVDTVLSALDKGGYDQVSLTSLSTADYSCVSPLIKRVMERLRERRASLSVSSLRAYGLDEDLLDEISSVKATGLTFAPEAGTQRMRDVINKNVGEAELMTTAERVFSRGWNRMKLYFIIGLPTETDEDVAGIIETAARARDVGLRYHKRSKLEVVASASSHVPKPHTPFQWAAMDSMEEVGRKQQLLKQLGRQHGITVRMHDQRISYLEGIVARGDRRVADLIELAFRKGARFDGWDEQLKWREWLEAIAETGLDAQRYLGTLPVDGGLPWDHVSVGLEDGFLAQEWKRAHKDRLSPPCGKPAGAQVHHTNVADAVADKRKLVCYHCGIGCDLTVMRDDRVVALTKLGAETRPVRTDDDPLPAWKTLRRDRKGATLPPLRQAQGDAFHYRVLYTKLGSLAMTSHLDLIRLLPRVLRRAGLPLKHSAGFSPKPLLVFGPALPLGVASVAEVMDLVALTELDPQELAERLDAVSEPGLMVMRAGRLDAKAMSCARIAKLAEYVVAAPGAWGEAELARATELARGDAPVEVTITRKNGDRVVDVRQGLLGLGPSVVTPAEAAALALPEGAPALRYRLDLDQAAHLRPDDIARGLLGMTHRPAGYTTARTGLWGLRKGRSFDLLAPDLLAAESADDASVSAGLT